MRVEHGTQPSRERAPQVLGEVFVQGLDQHLQAALETLSDLGLRVLWPHRLVHVQELAAGLLL
eukprot:CAMPEP_0204061570 /NCGR_PEP_ID=MMETSP0360-20130528/142406_1 /ASSEMBLY_ACC=CAM_ASM_000342 /TAXON_ID=268821 /ORGANISM="Scrippsiella Hangoei, Strain SHTV-5" /LENGTH=62 /DNA_ID=CAMNT_0051009315 /DNA_START=52 /DNA_END=237 /DNA_ORIENTATION=-